MDLMKRWGDFVKVILDPWFIVTSLLTLFLAWQLSQETEPRYIGLLTVVVTIFSGVAGGMLVSGLNALSEEGSIRARGQLAVRGLKLSLIQLDSFRTRLANYLETFSGAVQDNETNVVRAYLEESMERCELLSEQLLSSIENWTDIVPEADLKTQIGVMASLKSEIAKLALDLEELTGKSEQETQDLKDEIAQKRNELRVANDKLMQSTLSTGIIGTTGTAMSWGPDAGTSIFAKTCSKCGEVYVRVGASADSGICAKCSGGGPSLAVPSI